MRQRVFSVSSMKYAFGFSNSASSSSLVFDTGAAGSANAQCGQPYIRHHCCFVVDPSALAIRSTGRHPRCQSSAPSPRDSRSLAASSSQLIDIALDANYRREFQRVAALFGLPDAASKTSQEFDQQMVKSAEDPLFAILSCRRYWRGPHVSRF